MLCSQPHSKVASPEPKASFQMPLLSQGCLQLGILHSNIPFMLVPKRRRSLWVTKRNWPRKLSSPLYLVSRFWCMQKSESCYSHHGLAPLDLKIEFNRTQPIHGLRLALILMAVSFISCIQSYLSLLYHLCASHTTHRCTSDYELSCLATHHLMISVISIHCKPKRKIKRCVTELLEALNASSDMHKPYVFVLCILTDWPTEAPLSSTGIDYNDQYKAQ